MKKKILVFLFCFLGLFVLALIGNKIYWDYRVRHAIIHVELSYHEIPVHQENVTVDLLIKEINGVLKTNPVIDTTRIGKQEVTFQYVNEEKIPLSYTIEVEVVDTIPPLIFQSKSKTVSVGYDGDLEKDLFCGDNYDPNPHCYIEGEYDLNQVGRYDLTFVGEDSSSNRSSSSFTLIVQPKSNSSSGSGGGSYTSFSAVREKYQGENVHFGIDISHWQGDINFQKVKDAGVEFVYIRVGRGDGIGSDFVEDRKFVQNIQGFNKVGIPVGVYFYSNANSNQDAIKEAKWVLNKIKKYQVDLEIVYDWENWGDFQYYDLSFYQLTETAKAFHQTVSKAGYTGMLYSSKSYLLSVWDEVDFPKWLAHYTEYTNYTGTYSVWQLCDDGKVDGISEYVDLDIRYGDIPTKKTVS